MPACVGVRVRLAKQVDVHPLLVGEVAEPAVRVDERADPQLRTAAGSVSTAWKSSTSTSCHRESTSIDMSVALLSKW